MFKNAKEFFGEAVKDASKNILTCLIANGIFILGMFVYGLIIDIRKKG